MVPTCCTSARADPRFCLKLIKPRPGFSRTGNASRNTFVRDFLRSDGGRGVKVCFAGWPWCGSQDEQPHNRQQTNWNQSSARIPFSGCKSINRVLSRFNRSDAHLFSVSRRNEIEAFKASPQNEYF